MVKTNDTTQLVTDAQSGCQCALNQLAAEVCKRVYPTLYRITQDYNLSHDLSQETLLIMLRSLKNLKRVEGFWGWIHTIARNRAYDHFRKRRHREVVGLMDFDDGNSYENARRNSNVLKNVIDNETEDYLAAAIGNLRERHRDVVHLRYFEERSYSEIASMSRCTPQQARVRFFRAKRSLRKRLCAAGFEMDI